MINLAFDLQGSAYDWLAANQPKWCGIVSRPGKQSDILLKNWWSAEKYWWTLALVNISSNASKGLHGRNFSKECVYLNADFCFGVTVEFKADVSSKGPPLKLIWSTLCWHKIMMFWCHGVLVVDSYIRPYQSISAHAVKSEAVRNKYFTHFKAIVISRSRTWDKRNFKPWSVQMESLSQSLLKFLRL